MTKKYAGAERFAGAWRYCLFSLGAVLCIYQLVFFYLNFSSGVLPFMALHAMAAASAWFSVLAALSGFAALIPFINGICVLLPDKVSIFEVHGTVFSAIYLVWFFKRVVTGKIAPGPVTKAGFYIDLLITCVFFSLAWQLRYYPPAMLFPSLWEKSMLDQMSPLFCIPAVWTLSQGLLLYRMIETDPFRERLMPFFLRVACIQASTLVIFSGIQFFADIPAWRSLQNIHNRGISLPFDDLNSYASIAVLLYGIFLFCFIRGLGKARIAAGCAAGLLGLCIFYSLSRVALLTALTMTAVGIGFFLLRKKSFPIVLTIAAAGCALIVLLLLPQKIPNVVIPFTSHSLRQLADSSSMKYRINRWQVCFDMIQHSPLVGHGIGSFLRRYPFYSGFNEAQKTGKTYSSYQKPENAHNYFIQLAVDMGLSGLALFVLVLAAVFRSGLASLETLRPARLGLIAGLAGYLATCMTGHPLLLPSQQFMFWFAAAAISVPSSKPAPLSMKPLHPARVVVVCICCAVLAGYMLMFFSRGDRADYELGFYAWERWNNQPMRWTMKKSFASMPAASDIIRMNAAASPHNMGEKGLDLTLKIDDVVLDRQLFFEKKDMELIYYVPGIKGSRISITTEVSSTFCPLKLGISRDPRELGIALSPVTFLPDIPGDGIGFYGRETLPQGNIGDWPESGPPTFRWSGMRAFLPLTDKQSREGCTVFISASHPDIQGNPVRVTIRDNESRVYNEDISDHGWKKVLIRPNRYAPRRILTFNVSRTWCPAETGVSDDKRTLGVMVAVAQAKNHDR